MYQILIGACKNNQFHSDIINSRSREFDLIKYIVENRTLDEQYIERLRLQIFLSKSYFLENLTMTSNGIMMSALLSASILCPIIFDQNPSYSMTFNCSICSNLVINEIMIEPNISAIFNYGHLYCQHFQEIMDITIHDILETQRSECPECNLTHVTFNNHLFINCPSDHKFQVPLHHFPRILKVSNDEYILAGIVNFHDPDVINEESFGHYTACLANGGQWMIMDDLCPNRSLDIDSFHHVNPHVCIYVK